MKIWLVLILFVLLQTACAGTATPAPTPTPPPTPRPTPTSIPITVDQVMANLKSSPYLDRVHIDKGLNCQSCHTPFPPQGKPAPEICLACHKGSYGELAKTTTQFQEKNPHKAHIGNEPCTSCHGAHQPFVYLCRTCHSEWLYKGKYPTAPSNK